MLAYDHKKVHNQHMHVTNFMERLDNILMQIIEQDNDKPLMYCLHGDSFVNAALCIALESEYNRNYYIYSLGIM